MLKKRSKIQRGLIVFGSTFGSMADLTSGLWRSENRMTESSIASVRDRGRAQRHRHCRI